MHSRFAAAALAALTAIIAAAATGPAGAQGPDGLAAYDAEPAEVSDSAEARTYRTLCVRLCDGYYYPVSTRTTRMGLSADAERCSTGCQSEARLFFHPNPGGDVATAQDFTGLVYESLPNAFVYLSRTVDGCLCKPPPWSAAETSRHRRYAEGPPTSTGTLGGAGNSTRFDFAAQGERPLAVLRRAPQSPLPPPSRETERSTAPASVVEVTVPQPFALPFGPPPGLMAETPAPIAEPEAAPARLVPTAAREEEPIAVNRIEVAQANAVPAEAPTHKLRAEVVTRQGNVPRRPRTRTIVAECELVAMLNRLHMRLR